MTDEFPKWGFWTMGDSLNSRNITNRRHLFLQKEMTACGWNPKSRYYRYSFSSIPKLDGLVDIYYEMELGRRLEANDFAKCKRCLKKEKRSTGGN